MRKVLLMILLAVFATGLMDSSIRQADAAPILKPGQVHNLRLLIGTGQAEHRPQVLIIAGITTAYAETLLVNKDIRDDAGRPVFSGIFGLIRGAWGLYPAQQRVPRLAAHAFYIRAGRIHHLHPRLGAGRISQRVMKQPIDAYSAMVPVARTLFQFSLNHKYH